METNEATHVHVANFRLLEDADIALDDATTMIVGRNNSGKTSVVEIFRKLVKADGSPFSFDDLSLQTHSRFEEALNAYDKWVVASESGNVEDADAFLATINDLPAITLTITMGYEANDDISALAPFILDLDPDRPDATIVFKTVIEGVHALIQSARQTLKALENPRIEIFATPSLVNWQDEAGEHSFSTESLRIA